MIDREMSQILCQRASEFPVLTITGPRQSGKTTIVRSCFPNHAYVNLEDPETRELAETDYHRFFALHPTPVIIDEIQRESPSSPQRSRQSLTSTEANTVSSS